MKPKKTHRFLLIGCVFTVFSLTAQKEKVDCKYNTQEALFYLNGSSSIEKDSLKAMAYLKPCVEAKHATSQLIMGQVLLNSSEADRIQKGFQ